MIAVAVLFALVYFVAKLHRVIPPTDDNVDPSKRITGDW